MLFRSERFTRARIMHERLNSYADFLTQPRVKQSGLIQWLSQAGLDRAAIAATHKWMAPGLKGQAKGSRAFTSWDEDAVTMAVEAARDALVGVDAAAVEAIHLASNTAPYADLQGSSIVANFVLVALLLMVSDRARREAMA